MQTRVMHLLLCFTIFVAVILNVTYKTCALNYNPNSTIFHFQDVTNCGWNEYYDINSFACTACNVLDMQLHPTADKFSCECARSGSASTKVLLLYDTTKQWPTCVYLCNGIPIGANTATAAEQKCEGASNWNCKYKYVNTTVPGELSVPKVGSSSSRVLISGSNLVSDSNCSFCDLRYNYRYQDYCIDNALLKPYLHYNSFWQPAALSVHHFGNLKFVAFFCLRLRNSTACQHLANLCVMSHFSMDKNSPCGAFWLTQASVVVNYPNMDQQLYATKPFLFYEKSKRTAAQLLSEPILGIPYSINRKSHHQQLELFSTVFSLDGTLSSWGPLKLHQLDFCRLNVLHELYGLEDGIRFGQHYETSECSLTLEHLIDLSQIYANNKFINIYLNFTHETKAKNSILQSVPILIEDLTTENQRNQPEEWQLVKRFQLIEAHPWHFGNQQRPAINGAHKLQLYRSLRYIELFEIHYVIHENNRISIPLIKLHYCRIELNANSTLNDIYHYRLQVTFERATVTAAWTWWLEMLLFVALLAGFAIALMRAHNSKRRRRCGAVASDTDEYCSVACITEFILQMISNTSNAFLACFLLFITCQSLQFYTQQTVEITLPIAQAEKNLWKIALYVSLVLKVIFLGVHFWRISHLDLFFIDWERPRSCDNAHFNLKSNLETSSVCSSVRTFIADNNVSAWRLFFIANEWIRLSVRTKTSVMLQGLALLSIFKLMDIDDITHKDQTLRLFVISMSYIGIQIVQLIFRALIVNFVYGNPMQKFVDLCSLANISVFSLLESSYGFYIHGRSPHGFADTDMSSMMLQLHRESQNMCGQRGLLTDSDQQTYLIVPPTNLRSYFSKLLIPYQRCSSISQAHFHKETASARANFERTTIAYSSINRFFCAFIDHAIKDMDYIIKEKTLLEKLFNCECDSYLSENKGTFYIDKQYAFSQLSLYGNQLHIFMLELLLILSLYTLMGSLFTAVVVVCALNKLLQCVFREWERQNLATKTLIDKRFLL